MDLKVLLLPLGGVWKKILACLPAIVVEVEKAMKDGKIDSTERKAIAMQAVAIVAQEFGVALGWIAKFVISWLIDQLAKKLPSKDITIPAVVMGAVNSIK